ncbi:hypothetical protein I7I52_07335 [Histoplasma capsulatum]|uniref:Uncharacterized protein n=1 Tax=Ajellomyces capsulatus TaxID=5037 RepID=A0A8H8CTR7_AJECA|nr:hypothetical protein I7I52_07335 [Histoplasma capsulatum]
MMGIMSQRKEEEEATWIGRPSGRASQKHFCMDISLSLSLSCHQDTNHKTRDTNSQHLTTNNQQPAPSIDHDHPPLHLNIVAVVAPPDSDCMNHPGSQPARAGPSAGILGIHSVRHCESTRAEKRYYNTVL